MKVEGDENVCVTRQCTDRCTVPMRLPYEDGRVETVGGVYTVPMRLPYEDGRVEIVEGVAL